MVAWRPLLQGLIVEALRLGVALWGQDTASDFKASPKSSQWSCEQRQSFWETESRNCTHKLRELATCGVELEICKHHLQEVTRCSVQEAFSLGLFCGASVVGLVLASILALSCLCRNKGHLLQLHRSKADSETLEGTETIVRDEFSLVAARQRARALRG